MDTYSVQEIAGKSYIILQSADSSFQIDMDAISSWGVLLGLTDKAEIVRSILQESGAELGTVDWSELYNALGENLDAMSLSGVPVEFAEDLLDPSLGSPVPGAEKIEKLERVRNKAKTNLWAVAGGEQLTDAALSGLVTKIDSERVKNGRTDFIDALSPVYELTPNSPETLNDKPSV